MPPIEPPPWKDLRGLKTCIAGEVNTGKTRLLRRVLAAALQAGEREVVLLDLAPERTRGIGGKLEVAGVGEVRVLTAPIQPPRLLGRTPQEVLALARNNARLIEGLLRRLENPPPRAVFVNDVSLYLQAGDLERLWGVLEPVPSVVLNGYYGHSLGGGGLGERERRAMRELMSRCQRLIRL